MQDSVVHYSRGGFIAQARTGKAAPRRPSANNPPGGIYPCKPGGPNDKPSPAIDRRRLMAMRTWHRLVHPIVLAIDQSNRGRLRTQQPLQVARGVNGRRPPAALPRLSHGALSSGQ